MSPTPLRPGPRQISARCESMENGGEDLSSPTRSAASQSYSDVQLREAAAILGLPAETLCSSLGIELPANFVPAPPISPVLDDSFSNLNHPLFSFEGTQDSVNLHPSANYGSTWSLVDNPYAGLPGMQQTSFPPSPSAVNKYINPMYSPCAPQTLSNVPLAAFGNGNADMNVTSSSNGSACGLFVSRVPEIDTTHRWTLESSSPLPDLLRSGPNLCQPVTPEDKATYSELAPRYGPCSRSWELKPKSRKQTKSKASNRNPKSKVGVGGPSAGRRRGAFTDDRKRELTAQTRELKGCIRCRMHRVRCWPDPNNVNGSCLTCQRVTGPTICKLPCLRYIISDASVYREQAAPYQLFSKRWQNMELIDITTWASEETKTIVISQIFLDAPYQVKVKEFVPVEGDMLEEQWNSGSVVKSHKIPRYALADMEETAQMLQDFIDKSVAKYILGALAPRNSGKTEDELLYYTYMAAFKHIHEAKSHKERSLLQDCFRLWVGCRKTSNPHHISGDDKLGGEKVDDPSSPFFECVPMPVIMIAQMECIMYTKILRPLSKKVLDSLNDLVKDNKRKYWLTIYFTIFILLHSCSMITKRDEETAKQYGLQARYANLRSIQGHHAGAKTMLAHFHWLNKGALPFSLAVDSGNVAKLMAEAELTAEQSEFVHRTAFLVQERATLMKTIREEQEFGHDFYWISQLYDEEWLPGPSA